MGIGQHRSSGPATNNGQKNIRGGAADVGDMSGGEHQNAVPASRPNADISTTTGAAENEYARTHNHGKSR